jgi:hypothetical protein
MSKGEACDCCFNNQRGDLYGFDNCCGKKKRKTTIVDQVVAEIESDSTASNDINGVNGDEVNDANGGTNVVSESNGATHTASQQSTSGGYWSPNYSSQGHHNQPYNQSYNQSYNQPYSQQYSQSYNQQSSQSGSPDVSYQQDYFPSQGNGMNGGHGEQEREIPNGGFNPDVHYHDRDYRCKGMFKE